MIGLYMMGTPKVMGSLMLKMPGMMPALPTARSCSDLERRHITQSGSVSPVPPQQVSADHSMTG